MVSASQLQHDDAAAGKAMGSASSSKQQDRPKRPSWEERIAARTQHRHSLPPALRIAFSRYVWWKIIFALRGACIAMLIPAILITVTKTTIAFNSKSFAILAGLLTARETLGGAVHTTYEWFKSLFFAVPLTTIYIAVHLYVNVYAWSVFFVLSFIVAAYLYDGLAKKIVLLIVNATMVAQLMAYHDKRGPGMLLEFPSRIVCEFFIGCFFGMLSTLLPWPKFAWRRADQKIALATESISIAFAGLCDTFWTSSNLQRRINISHIKGAQLASLAALEDAGACMREAHLEPQSLDRYFLRVAKFQLVSSFPPLIESTLRVLEAVSEDPFVVHGNRYAEAFGEALREPLKELGEAVEDALALIVKGSSIEDFQYDAQKLKMMRKKKNGTRTRSQRKKTLKSGGDCIEEEDSDDEEHLAAQLHNHPLRRVKRALRHLQYCYARARRDVYYTVHRKPVSSNGGAIASPTTANKPSESLQNLQRQIESDFASSNKESNSNTTGAAAVDGGAAAFPAPVSPNTPHSPTSLPSVAKNGSGEIADTFYVVGYDLSPAAQEFNALMAFYLFTISMFANKTLSFPALAEDRREGKTIFNCIYAELWGVLKSTIDSLFHLVSIVLPDSVLKSSCWSVFPASSPEQTLMAGLKLREGAKFGIAMGLSLLFFYYTDRRFAFLQGPQVLCFVASTTSSEAFYGAVMRLFGTLFGGIIGFFAASQTHTPVEKVAALVVVMIFFNFFRSGKQYGGAALYAGVVFVPMIGVTTMTMNEAMSRITQVTFATMIYFCITIVIFPTRPIAALTQVRLQGLAGMGRTFRAVMGAFAAPIPKAAVAPQQVVSSAVDESVTVEADKDAEMQVKNTANKTTTRRSNSASSSSSSTSSSSASSEDDEGSDLQRPRRNISNHPYALRPKTPTTPRANSAVVAAAQARQQHHYSSSAKKSSMRRKLSDILFLGKKRAASPATSGAGGETNFLHSHQRHPQLTTATSINNINAEDTTNGNARWIRPDAREHTSLPHQPDEASNSGTPFNSRPPTAATTDVDVLVPLAVAEPPATVFPITGPAPSNRSAIGTIDDGSSEVVSRRRPPTATAHAPDVAADDNDTNAEPIYHASVAVSKTSTRRSGAVPQSVAPPLPADTVLHSAQAALRVLDGLIAKAAAWMPLAEMEPNLTRAAYPVNSSRSYQQSTMKMRSLLELMVEGLKTLRAGDNTAAGTQNHHYHHHNEQHSPLFLVALESMGPTATECAEALVVVMEMLVAKMALGESYTLTVDNVLERACCSASGANVVPPQPPIISVAELVAASLRFEELSLRLHDLKGNIMLKLVKVARMVYDKQQHQYVDNDDEKKQHGADSSVASTPLGPAGAVTSKSTPFYEWSEKALIAAADEIVAAAAASNSSNTTSAHHHRHNRQKLRMLISTEDAEGLHTFTFCLVLFCKELKQLLVTIEALQQHAMGVLSC